MKSNWIKGASLIALAAGFAGVAAAQIGADAPAPEVRSEFLGYAVSISPRFIFTDNVNLAPKGFEQSEYIPSLDVSGAVVFANRRITGIVSGSVDTSYFIDNDAFVLNQDVGGSATATLAENFLYLDASASASRQLVGDQAAFSTNANAARGDRANVYSMSFSPYVLHQFVNGSEAEIRYRRSDVFVDDDLVGDSHSDEALARYTTGPLLGRLTLSGLVYGRRTRDDASTFAPAFSFEQGTLAGRAEYAVTYSLALTGTVGYDEVDVDETTGFFTDDELSGIFWNAGFHAKPNRRTDIMLAYGRRYGGDFLEAEINYELTPRTFISGGASRTFQTRSLGINDLFRNTQASALAYAERLRGLQNSGLSGSDIAEAAGSFSATAYGLPTQLVGLGLIDTAYANFFAELPRTRFIMGMRYDNADYGFQEITSVTGNLHLSRELGRRFSVYGDMIYRYSDSSLDATSCLSSLRIYLNDPALTDGEVAGLCADPAILERASHTLGGVLGLQYQISRRLAAYGQVMRTNRFAEDAIDEYVENAAMAGIRLDF